MTDNIERLARFGGDPDWLALADTKNGKSTLDGAGRIYRHILRLDSEFQEVSGAINSNGDLTAKGRAKAKAEKVEKTLAELEPARRGLAKIAAELVAKRIEAEAAITPKDETLAYHKSAEIRSWMSRDPLVNIAVVNQAMLDGDSEIVAAVLDSPLSWPGRPPEDNLVGLREQRIAMAMGAAETEATRQLSEIHNDLSGVLASAESGIKEAAGMPVDDVVAIAAAAE